MKRLSKMIKKELTFLIPRAFGADAALWLILLPMYGFCADIPLGLLFGTLVMIVNIYLLGYASERAVQKELASAKRYMFFFYAVRMLMMGLAFIAAVNISWLNVVTVAIPTVYPRVFYTADAIFKEKRSKKEL